MVCIGRFYSIITSSRALLAFEMSQIYCLGSLNSIILENKILLFWMMTSDQIALKPFHANTFDLEQILQQ